MKRSIQDLILFLKFRSCYSQSLKYKAKKRVNLHCYKESLSKLFFIKFAEGTLKKMEKLLAKIQSPQNLGFNATITKLQVECITDILQRQSSSELALLEKKTNKMIISKLVALATLKPRKKSLFDALCQNFLDAQLEQLKLKISSFEDQFLFIRDVIFKAGNEGSQTVIDEEEKEREAPVRKTSQEPLFDFTLELPMHPSLQYFALKSLESLLYITNLQSFKARGNQYRC